MGLCYRIVTAKSFLVVTARRKGRKTTGAEGQNERRSRKKVISDAFCGLLDAVPIVHHIHTSP